MKIRAVVFDLGDTLIHQVIDSERPLDQFHLNLMPYVKQCLQNLYPLYRIGLLTNTEQSDSINVTAALHKLTIAHFFQAIVTSTDIGRKKPDTILFTTVLDKLHVHAVQAIMVGNDLNEDVRPAKALGMATAYFTKTPTPILAEADIQFSSFRHLPTLLEEFENRENDQP